MVIIILEYHYVRVGYKISSRMPNNAFFSYRNDQKYISVKISAINYHLIRTVLKKINKVGNMLLESDLRVKHMKQSVVVYPSIKGGIKQHIK
ncbi:hypothetical protein PR048_016485 [Dryococelus australis]|uniref:Uncharacterized protein n=1 Tax=Dryococelus australis TaxID=614101 RepID=A0ABQ9HJW6_9NEOP|nr:hypothetical protein PR048_016485 [Dryococelus australis]